MSTARYIIGDTRDVTASLPDASVDLVMTSPPFLALRSYLPPDHPDKWREIGSEPTPAEFLQTLLELTAEWRRVLAPHGSIAVELGDTYAGSGGAGGDYGPDGMRGGQEKFKGSALADRKNKVLRADGNRMQQGNGWPMDKSICGIPWLYALSLAYGRNMLTGEPSPAGQWRVRNVVAWCRPNPPVGALGDKPHVKDLLGTVKVMLDEYQEGKLDAVYLCYTRFINTMKQEPLVEALLPLTATRLEQTAAEKTQYGWDYIYEPDAPTVIDELLTRYIEALVYQAVADNMASEQSARMVAMKAATDNAGNLIAELKLVYNKTRQAAITKELSEIVGGAAAV